MKKQLKCIMLVDDNPYDNFFHERVIKRNNSRTIIITKNNGLEALKYFASMVEENNVQPDLIFLDIYMPFINGWEFLKEFNLLDIKLQNHVIIIMLSTSDYLDDHLKMEKWGFVSDFIVKPLTSKKMDDIIIKYFN